MESVDPPIILSTPQSLPTEDWIQKLPSLTPEQEGLKKNQMRGELRGKIISIYIILYRIQFKKRTDQNRELIYEVKGFILIYRTNHPKTGLVILMEPLLGGVETGFLKMGSCLHNPYNNSYGDLGLHLMMPENRVTA